MHLKSHWKQWNDSDGLLIKANILIWWNDEKKACPSITQSTNVNMAAIFWLLQNILIIVGNWKLSIGGICMKAHLVFECVFLCYFFLSNGYFCGFWNKVSMPLLLETPASSPDSS